MLVYVQSCTQSTCTTQQEKQVNESLGLFSKCGNNQRPCEITLNFPLWEKFCLPISKVVQHKINSLNITIQKSVCQPEKFVARSFFFMTGQVLARDKLLMQILSIWHRNTMNIIILYVQIRTFRFAPVKYISPYTIHFLQYKNWKARRCRIETSYIVKYLFCTQ